MARPTKFKKEMIKDAEQLAGLGFTEENLATYWGIHPETLRRWKHKTPELSGVIERGKLHANISVTKAMYNNAVKNNNFSAQVFWLTNRTPESWQDRRAIVNNKISIQNNDKKQSIIEELQELGQEEAEGVIKTAGAIANRLQENNSKLLPQRRDKE